MKKSIIVTGVNGFVGHHVARQLHEQGIPVIGIGNQPSPADTLEGVTKYISCDLTSADDVKSVDFSDVDAVINLAGLAKISDAHGKIELYEAINVGVHSTLMDEALRQNCTPRFIAVSSGAVYDPNQPLPITESSALVPHANTNEYVISKQLMEDAVVIYRKHGLEVIIARPFNHSGPGQLPGFLLPDLGEQIADAIEAKKPLLVGNLETKRYYTDVRDVASAYIELATSASLKHNLYNICSGKSTSGTEILNILMEAFGADNLEIEKDESRLRPNDVMDSYGSSERLSTDTGWQPTITIEQMIQDYAEWKKKQK